MTEPAGVSAKVNGSTKLVYTVMSALGIVLLSVTGIAIDLAKGDVGRISDRVDKVESSVHEMERWEERFHAEIHNTCVELCRTRKALDDYKQEHTNRPIIRDACLCSGQDYN